MIEFAILSVPLCFAFSVYFALRWTSFWRLAALLPLLFLLAGLVSGYIQQSNLWPFWIIDYSREGAVCAIILFVLHFATRRLHGM